MKLLAENLVHLLIDKKLTISTAESCTGGLLSSLITSVPDSSKIFECGICSYSNRIKHKLLNIPQNTLYEKGEVSKETAEYMSREIKLISNSDIGVAITGIAGPSGGTKEKPVGLVYISTFYKNINTTKKLLIEDKGRDYIRSYSVKRLLELITDII